MRKCDGGKDYKSALSAEVNWEDVFLQRRKGFSRQTGVGHFHHYEALVELCSKQCRMCQKVNRSDQLRDGWPRRHFWKAIAAADIHNLFTGSRISRKDSRI